MVFDKNKLSLKIQTSFPQFLAIPFSKYTKEKGIWQKGAYLLKIHTRTVRFITGIYLSYAGKDFLLSEKENINACSYESWIIQLLSLLKNSDIKLPENVFVSENLTDILNRSLNIYKEWFFPENYVPENKEKIFSTIDEFEKITWELFYEIEKFCEFYVIAPLIKEGEIHSWLLYNGSYPIPLLIQPIWDLPPEKYEGGVCVFKEGEEKPRSIHPYIIYKNIEAEDSIYLHNILIGAKPILYETPSGILCRSIGDEQELTFLKDATSIIGQMACLEHFGKETFDEMKKGFLRLKMPFSFVEFLWTNYLLQVDEKKKLAILKEAIEILTEIGEEDFLSKVSDIAYKISQNFEKEKKLDGNLKEVEEIILDRIGFTRDYSSKFRDLLKLTNLYREQLRSEEGAFYCLLKALEIQPSDESILEQLMDIAENLEKWNELANELENIAKRAKSDSAKVLYTAAGLIFGKNLNNFEKAEFSYLSALKIDEKDVRALKGLAEIYEQGGKLKKFVEVQKRRLKIAENVEERIEILQTTLIAYRVLNDKKGLEWTLKGLLLIDPENEEAIKQSLNLLYESKEYSQLEGLYCELLKKVVNPELRIFLYEGLADLRANILGAKTGAKECYEILISYKGEHETALKFLENYYFEEGLKEKYIMIQRKLIELSKGEEKIERMIKLSNFYIEKIDDPYSALSVIENIIEEEPKRFELFQIIEKIYTDLKMWEDLRVLYNRMLDVVSEKEKVSLRIKIANLFWREFHISQNAVEHFWEVLKYEPLNSEAINGLTEIYEKAGNWEKMLFLLEYLQINSKDDSDKVKYLLSAAKIYKEKFEDTNNYLLCLEKAGELSPLDEEIALNLAEMYSKLQKWEKIPPLLGPVVLELEKKEQKKRSIELRKFIANSALNRGDKEKAISEYEVIFKENPSSVNIRLKLANLYIEKSNYYGAESLVSEMKGNIEDLKPSEKLELYNILSELAIEKKEFSIANDFLKEIAKLKKDLNKDFYKKVLAVAKGANDNENIIWVLKNLYSFEQDPLEKLSILIEIGDTYWEKLQNYESALATYNSALSIKPDSKTAIHKILEMAIKKSDFHTAKETLVRIINLEEDGKKKASYHYALGLMGRDNLKDRELGKYHFNTALQFDPENEEIFRDLETIYIEDKNYNELSELYSASLRYYKAKNNRKKIEKLVEKLSDLYYETLNNPVKSTFYLEQLFELRPNDNKLLERLAFLYETKVGKREKAVSLYRNLLKKYPLRYELYRKITELLQEGESLDKFWCATGVLCVIGKEKEAERTFFNEYKSAALKLKRGLTPEIYKECILSSQEDPIIGRVLHILSKPIFHIIPWKNPQELSISEGNLVDLNTKGLFNDLVKIICKIYGINPPCIYYAEERTGIVKVAFNPPALIVGEDCMKEKRGKDLRFILGKLLTTFFPEHIVVGIVEPKTLKDFFLGGISCSYEDYVFEGVTDEIRALGKEISQILYPAEKLELKKLFDLFFKEGEAVDLNKWINGVEYTANHAGLFIANDIEVAVTMLRKEPISLSSLDVEDKILELLCYSISDEFFRLRAEMGITIDAIAQKC